MQPRQLTMMFLLCAAANAQCILPGPSTGPLAGAPFLYSEAGSAGSTGMKCPGFGAAATAYGPISGRPDLDIGGVLARATAGAPPEIDAISFGLDVVVADSSGRAVMPPERWATLAFAVSKDSKGSGGLISQEARGAGGAAGDVFSYVLPGSTLSPFGGMVQRAQDSTEFLPASGQQAAINALDFHAPMYTMDQAFYDELATEPLVVYFSVTGASVPLVPASWWSGATPSGATILQMAWDFGAGRWSEPRAFLAAGAMELAASDDVDALAVDATSNASPVVLFSTTDVTRPQVWVHFTGGTEAAAASTMVYRGASGNPIEIEIGLATRDDITALCEIDPTIDQEIGFWPPQHRLHGKHPIRFAMAWPVGKTPLGLPVGLDASAFVTCDTGKTYRSFALGWPGGVPASGVAGLLLELPGPAFAALTPILSRNVLPVFCGDPQSGGFGVGRPPFSAFRLTDTLLTLHWLALDTNANFVTSYPLLVHL